MAEKPNIYKIARTIKRRDNTLYNALRSIYEDSVFVGEIAQLWPELPLLANLRCGLWYSPKFDSNCYFKSTDGHTNNLSFSTSRLNLHVALLAGQRRGCIIVDSTRKGKRFPDSMSKTIPIWACVLNRAVFSYRRKLERYDSPDCESDNLNKPENLGQHSSGWDCSLHLPLWVSETEKAMIEHRLDGWDKELEASAADITSVASTLRKPLRPLWISQKTVIWLNEVPEYDSWDFTPIILVSASSSNGTFQQRTTSEFSWNYIAGAGDDEESWARSLSPDLFWKNAYNIISSGPDTCNQKIADIVEEDRVRRAHRGENAPQVSVRPLKHLPSTSISPTGEPLELNNGTADKGTDPSNDNHISFVGSSNIAVGKSQLAMEVPSANCILNCGTESLSVSVDNPEMYLHLPILDSKIDRFFFVKEYPCCSELCPVSLEKGEATSNLLQQWRRYKHMRLFGCSDVVF